MINQVVLDLKFNSVRARARVCVKARGADYYYHEAASHCNTVKWTSIDTREKKYYVKKLFSYALWRHVIKI